MSKGQKHLSCEDSLRRVQIVQPEEEKTMQKLHGSLSVLKNSFSERQRQTFL